MMKRILSLMVCAAMILGGLAVSCEKDEITETPDDSGTTAPDNGTTPDDGTDNDGSGNPGDDTDNTGDNTGDNTDDSTDDNAGDNTDNDDTDHTPGDDGDGADSGDNPGDDGNNDNPGDGNEGADAPEDGTPEHETVPNLSFDDWNETAGYWSPNAEGAETVWDSANKASSLFRIIPTSCESDHLAVEGEGKHAAKLESKNFLGILAAGNLYTGQFVELSGLGAALNWGYPFSSRPVALKGYYDYRPAVVDHAKDPYTEEEGQPDKGQIQIFLTDWTEPFRVDTSNSVFVDFGDSHILARGVMELDGTENYTPFTLNLEYRDTETTPTYIVITCAASRYGDYFTGGTGSTLYVDEFELVY